MNLIAPIPVTLTDEDIQFAKQIGKKRSDECTRRGYPDKYGYAGDPLVIDIIGACGELAFCKGVGLVWDASVNTFKMPDARHDIQIRTAPCKKAYPPNNFGNLIVHRDDDPRDNFVLVVGNSPNFVIKGWLLGRDAMQERWLRSESNRPAQYYVPFSVLHFDLAPLLDS